MRRAFVLPLFLWMMMWLSALWAAEAQPVRVDLASATDLALGCSLTIRASAQNITTANKVVDQVKGLGYGHLNLNANAYHLNSPIVLQPQTFPFDDTAITIPGQTVANQDVRSANLVGSYPLFDAGRVRYGTRSATYRVAEAQNVYCDTRLSVVQQSGRTYLAAIYGRETVRLNEASLKSYQEHLDSARKSRKEGVATDYDVIRAESAVEDQKKRLAEVQNQFELALANLRTVLNLSKDACIDLQGGFFDIPNQGTVCDAEERAVKVDPLLASIADKSQSLHMAEKAVKAEALPQLDVVGFWNLVPRTSSFLTNAQWFVGMQLNQVIFDGGVIRARAAEQRSEREKNDTDYCSTANDLRLSVRSAYLDMNTAYSAMTAAKKGVVLAKESLRLAERRFAEGVGTSLEVLDANVNVLSSETGVQQSYFQLDSAYVTAHRYLGDLIQVAQSAQSAGGACSSEGR